MSYTIDVLEEYIVELEAELEAIYSKWRKKPHPYDYTVNEVFDSVRFNADWVAWEKEMLVLMAK